MIRILPRLSVFWSKQACGPIALTNPYGPMRMLSMTLTTYGPYGPYGPYGSYRPYRPYSPYSPYSMRMALNNPYRPLRMALNNHYGLIGTNGNYGMVMTRIGWMHSFKRHLSNQTKREEVIWNVPNALTMARMGLSPFIGMAIYNGQLDIGLTLLILASLTDALDGYLARKWNQTTWLGSALDPLADKILITTLTISTMANGLIPLYLGCLVIGRDLLLVVGTASYRYASLPHPKTLSRYFDPSLPTIEVKPPLISKINTALQLLWMSTTLGFAYVGIDSVLLVLLQAGVATTTIWSGLHYLVASRSLIRML